MESGAGVWGLSLVPIWCWCPFCISICLKLGTRLHWFAAPVPFHIYRMSYGVYQTLTSVSSDRGGTARVQQAIFFVFLMDSRPVDFVKRRHSTTA